jgi:hypothetical protein
MWGISWLADNLLASQEGLCYMELVNETYESSSWAGIVSVPQAGRWMVEIVAASRHFFLQSSTSIQGSTQPPTQWVQGAFPQGKADHSHLSSVKVKEKWDYNSMWPTCHHRMNRDFNFTLPFFTFYFAMTSGIRWFSCITCTKCGIWIEGEHIKMSVNIIS